MNVIPGVVASQMAAPLVLDNIPAVNIASAYSVRRLRTAYTGAAMEVRRDNDDSTADVSFDNTGVVSLNSPVSAGGTLGAWVATNNAFVQVWYDQSDNGNDALTAAFSEQPKIVSAGVLVTDGTNNRTSTFWNGLNQLIASDSASLDLNSTMTCFSIVEFDNWGTGVGTIFDKRDNSLTSTGYLFVTAPNLYLMQWNTTTSPSAVTQVATISASTLVALSATATKGGNVTMYQNTTNLGTSTLTATGSSVSTADFLLGGNKAGPGGGQSLSGHLSENILLNIIADSGQLSSIQTNQVAYYGT